MIVFSKMDYSKKSFDQIINDIKKGREFVKRQSLNQLRTPQEIKAPDGVHPYEVLFLEFMKEFGLSPIPQYKIGKYKVDFAFIDVRLAIELDGSVHDNRQDYDEERDSFIVSNGWEIKRFKDDEVENNPQEVIDKIKDALVERDLWFVGKTWKE